METWRCFYVSGVEEAFRGTFATATVQNLCVEAATAQPFHKATFFLADELAEGSGGRIDPHADK